jgi:hypothetical protein
MGGRTSWSVVIRWHGTKGAAPSDRRYVIPPNVEPSPLGIGTYALSGPAVGGASVATTGRCWVTVLGRDSRGDILLGRVLKRLWEATMKTRTTVSGLGQSAPEVA